MIIYLVGSLVVAIICFIVVYYVEEQLTALGLSMCAFAIVLSWGVIIPVLFLFLGYLAENGNHYMIWNKHKVVSDQPVC